MLIYYSFSTYKIWLKKLILSDGSIFSGSFKNMKCMSGTMTEVMKVSEDIINRMVSY